MLVEHIKPKKRNLELIVFELSFNKEGATFYKLTFGMLYKNGGVGATVNQSPSLHTFTESIIF